MRTLYNISIHLFSFSVFILSFFIPKIRKIHKGQKNILFNIKSEIQNNKNIVCFHCASLGEFEQARNVILEYKVKNPHHKILITFFSPSGFEIVRHFGIADWVFYLPFDTRKNAKKFIESVQPIKMIFVKSEFWFNYIIELKKKNIPTFFISSSFRKNQYFFKFYGKWFSNKLKSITHFFVQNTESETLLNKIGIHKVSISGDSRFDTVKRNSQEIFSNTIIEEFTKNKKTIIAGSTWEKDEQLIFELSDAKTNYNFIIAPHEIGNCKSLLKNENIILLSSSTLENIKNKKILIIDCIGILSKIYRYANFSYIGGGFGKGIHNTLEASVYNIPVIFGPNYHNFPEAKELINLGIAKTINTSDELINAINHFENRDVSEICKNYFQKKIGATEKIIDII